MRDRYAGPRRRQQGVCRRRRAGWPATAEVDRHDFGVSFNGQIPGSPGGVIVSDKVNLHLEIEAALQQG